MSKCAAKSHRIADPDHPIAHFERIGVAQLENRQVVRVNLYYSDISVRISSDDLSLKFSPVRKFGIYRPCIFYKVIACQNMTIVRYDNTKSSGFWTRFLYSG